MEVSRLTDVVRERTEDVDRLIVAIAGPPGAGKSTLAETLRQDISAAGLSVAVVPMDGFHFDDRLLEDRGLLARKGSPETFDVAGFRHLLGRLRACEPDIAIPVFDRAIEIARAGAAIVAADTQVILVEGNYLLLDEAPWNSLAEAFDLTVRIEVPFDELERRLIQRWLGLGYAYARAREKALSNDIPNARRVVKQSRAADISF